MDDRSGTDTTARATSTTTAATPAEATTIEATLCRLFAEVLQVPTVGVEDDFFALGAESVHMLTLISQIATTLDIVIPLTVVFDHSTVAELAVHLTGGAGTPVD
jgi:acyl carrier protein